jgi:hypothetical protein
MRSHCYLDRRSLCVSLSSRLEAATPLLVISTGGRRPQWRDLAANEPCLAFAPRSIGRTKTRFGRESASQIKLRQIRGQMSRLCCASFDMTRGGDRFARHDKRRGSLRSSWRTPLVYVYSRVPCLLRQRKITRLKATNPRSCVNCAGLAASETLSCAVVLRLRRHVGDANEAWLRERSHGTRASLRAGLASSAVSGG